MADTFPQLWCLIEGDTRPFLVTSGVSIYELKTTIIREARIDLPAYKLELWKVRCF